jgi:hypothetical protein
LIDFRKRLSKYLGCSGNRLAHGADWARIGWRSNGESRFCTPVFGCTGAGVNLFVVLFGFFGQSSALVASTSFQVAVHVAFAPVVCQTGGILIAELLLQLSHVLGTSIE